MAGGGLQWSSAIFKVNLPTRRLHGTQTVNCHKMYVAKTTAYIIDQSGGDFQQGDCMYKPTNGIQWHSMDTRTPVNV